ncbi:MAG: hypothetical protein RR858_04375 [Mucinivorans sp.]
MKNIFSSHRFATYATAEIGSASRQILIDLAVYTIALAAIYLYNIPITIPQDIPQETFIQIPYRWSNFIMFLAMGIYVGRAFKKFHKPLEASLSMLVPASKVEKFVFSFLFYMVAIPGLLLLINYLAFRCSAYSLDLNNLPFFGGDISLNDCLGFSVIALSFFLGSTIFRRNQLIYTIGSLIALSISTNYLLKLLPGNIVNDTIYGMNLYGLWSLLWSLLIIVIITLSWWRFKKLQIR